MVSRFPVDALGVAYSQVEQPPEYGVATEKRTLSPRQLENLIPVLQRRGYQVVGPVVREGAIVYDVVEKLADLPAGLTDEQAAGRYRLQRRNDQALFGYAVGPH